MPSVIFPEAQLIGAVDAAALAIQQGRKETLEIIGTKLLSFSRLDYETKSRGGTGDDGVSWAPLKVSTILARMRKAGHLKSKSIAGSKIPKGVPISPGQRSVGVIARTVKANQKLLSALDKAGVQFHDRKGKKIIGDRARYRTGTHVTVGSATRNKTVSFSLGAYQIGVDTGLQRASAGPGYSSPDGKGGNIFKLTETSITVGYGRSYSKHFDKHRKLFPETLPAEWLKELEAITSERGGQLVADAFRENGVS